MSDDKFSSRASSAFSAVASYVGEAKRTQTLRTLSYRRDTGPSEVAHLADVPIDFPVEDVEIAVATTQADAGQQVPGASVDGDMAKAIEERTRHFGEALLRRAVEGSGEPAFEACERLREMSPEDVARLAADGAAEAHATIEETAAAWMRERKASASKSSG